MHSLVDVDRKWRSHSEELIIFTTRSSLQSSARDHGDPPPVGQRPGSVDDARCAKAY